MQSSINWIDEIHTGYNLIYERESLIHICTITTYWKFPVSAITLSAESGSCILLYRTLLSNSVKKENHRFMLNKGSWPEINFYIFVYISTLFGICKKYWERKALTKLAFLVTESLWSRKFTETHRNRFKDIWWLSSLFRAGFSLVSYRHVCTHVYTCSTLYICGY